MSEGLQSVAHETPKPTGLSPVVFTKKEPTLSQTRHMAVGDTIRDRLAAGGALKQLVDSHETPQPILEELFVRALSRKSTDEEQQALQTLIGQDVKDYALYEDIFWGLLNSTEFGFND